MAQMEFNLQWDDAPASNVLPDRGPGLDVFTRLDSIPRRLHLPQYDPESQQRVVRAFQLAPNSLLATLVSSMVIRRGWDSPEQLELLLAGAARLPDPALLTNYASVVNRICQAIARQEPIALCGDYDVDGITALALTSRLLKSTATPHTAVAPNRFIDGFGISTRLVAEILAGEPKSKKPYGLVILLDHGSQAHEHINTLRKNNIDVIALDHHEVHGVLPDALVINPRQPGCGWSTQYPCAAALAHVVASEVAARCCLPKPDYSLAGVATIADMVPLTPTSICNRIIAGAGLLDLRRTTNPGILALAEALGLGPHPQALKSFAFTSDDIAFQIAPALNAIGRLGDPNIGVELLTTDDPQRAQELAAHCVQINKERKRLQGARLMSNLEMLSQQGRLSDVIVCFDQANHLGLNGLVAQQLSQRFGRPSLVFAPNGEDLLVGSARAGHERYNIMSLFHDAHTRAASDNAGFVRYGGHKPAGGATLSRQHLSALQRHLNDSSAQIYGVPLSSIDVEADCQMRISELTPALFARCEAMLEPFGNCFSGPHILCRAVRIEGIRPPQHPGGRFTVTLTQGSARIDALIGSELWSSQLQHGTTLDIVASPMKLYRNTEARVQLSVMGFTITKQPKITRGASDREQAPHTTPSINEQQLVVPSAYLVPEPTPLPSIESAPTSLSDVHSSHLWRSAQPKKLTEKLKELKASQGRFDSRFLYPHLEELVPDYFVPMPPEKNSAAWRQLCESHKLHFDHSKLEIRPEAFEFIEYFFRTGESQILQAPTNSGKTKIALMIASHFASAGHRVVFVAPTREIARQVYSDLPSLFGEDVPRLLLIGGVPNKRKAALSAFDTGYIVGTAATLKNDVKDGSLIFSGDDLLVVDECHHATGRDSAVSIIEHSKIQNTRRLLLSATPWQVKKGESAGNLERLKWLAGVDRIFPLNRPPHQNAIRVQFCQLSPHMKEADAYLRQAMDTYRDELLHETDLSIRQVAERLRPCFSKEAPAELLFLSRATLDGLSKPQSVLSFIRATTTAELREKDLLGKLLNIRREIARSLSQVEDEFVSLNKVRELNSKIASDLGYKSRQYWLSRGVMELAYLHRILINEGIPGFMVRALEKRCGILFPKPLSKTEKRSAWGEHITDLYVQGRSTFLERAFLAVAPGESYKLWQHEELAGLFSTTTNDWFTKNAQERSRGFRAGFLAVKRQLYKSFENPTFFAHPADEFIFHDIKGHRQKSFIWVDKVEQVKLLSQHMNKQFDSGAEAVVGLTGAGRPGQPGMTGYERDRALAAYRDDPKTRVIIGTTALNEGIDVQGVTGYERSLKGSFIQSTQKAGRPGRRDRSGEILLLCSTRQQYRTVLSNISKAIENQEMLNTCRAEIASHVGLTPVSTPLTKPAITPRPKTKKRKKDDHQPRLF